MKWHEKLRFARKVKGLSLDQVAEKGIISKSYLCEIEKGKIVNPSIGKIRGLLSEYNLTFDDIFQDE